MMLVKPRPATVESFESAGNALLNQIGYAADAISKAMLGEGSMSDVRSYNIEQLNHDLANAQQHLDTAMQHMATMKRVANRFRQD